MTEKYFDYEAEELRELDKDSPENHPTRSLKAPHIDYSGELYGRLGTRLPATWLSGAKAEPVIDTDDLNGVSETEIKDALISMKNDGVL